MMFFDDNFVFKRYVDCPEGEIWPYTAQDIETDGYFVYAIGYNPNHISVVGMDGSLIKVISNTAFTGEPESMCYDWINGNYYIEGKSTYYVIRQAVFKE